MIVDTVGLFQRGFKAGEAGKAQKSCPYSQADLRKVWVAGWKAGKVHKAKHSTYQYTPETCPHCKGAPLAPLRMGRHVCNLCGNASVLAE
ncbi:ribosome modulation factor [Stutzerimonas stutzeri]|uniref:ribosome modulation factor n=1 Tax=Stutzerimonas stutzeri TaxID=316 RepID=UPI0015E2F79B|nr:ribosome modulation factor [Stutzerimonas stutzeri]MBA1280258.1 hypothetical protein [Stutzerimonas stutzeri]